MSLPGSNGRRAENNTQTNGNVVLPAFLQLQVHRTSKAIPHPQELGVVRDHGGSLTLIPATPATRKLFGAREQDDRGKTNERETKEDFPLLSLSIGVLFSALTPRMKGFLLRFSLSLPQFSFQYI